MRKLHLNDVFQHQEHFTYTQKYCFETIRNAHKTLIKYLLVSFSSIKDAQFVVDQK